MKLISNLQNSCIKLKKNKILLMTNKTTKKYVESIKTYFDTNKNDTSRLLITYNRLLNFLECPQIDSNKKLLDLGSGDGSFVEVCKDINIDAFALDAYSHKINFENDNLPYDNEFFDYITLTSLIEHIVNPKILLEEIGRILKKDGFLIITTPNFKYSYKIFYDDPTHVKPYTKTSIERLLSFYDFETIKTVPFLVNKSTLLWKTPFSFQIASMLPFKNHEFKKNFFIPNFLRGKSTAMTSVAIKKKRS